MFLALLLNLKLAFKLRTNINFKIIIPVIITSFLGRIAGVNILMYLPEDTLKTIFGFLLIIIALYFILYKNKVKFNPTKTKGGIAGFFSGLLGGAFNSGGPPVVIYYVNALKEKMTYLSTLQATFAFNCIFTISIHFYYGNINTSILMYVVSGIFGVLVGSYLGLIVFKKIPETILKNIIYGFMIFMGIMLIVK